MADTILVCSFHQSGHCRYGSHCNKRHTVDTCTNFPCMKEDCNKRHPKLCRYFTVSGFCKFNEQCSYLHMTSNIELKSQLEKEVAKLKQEIKSLYDHVSELRSIVNRLSTSSRDSSATSRSITSTITATVPTPALCTNLGYRPENSIPQLDGGACTPRSDVDFKCETCQKTFEDEDEFKLHDSFQFCCDECSICFSSQIAAHLHELDAHPDSFYARTYIPESTKQMFTSSKFKK